MPSSSPRLFRKKYHTHPRPHRMMIASMTWCSTFLTLKISVSRRTPKKPNSPHNRTDKCCYEIEEMNWGFLTSLSPRATGDAPKTVKEAETKDDKAVIVLKQVLDLRDPFRP